MITTNAKTVLGKLRAKVQALHPGSELADKICRAAATGVLAEMKTRIHEEGKKSDGSKIGTYSSGYMAVRTDGPRYNRTSDTKVILSLTGQMENDFKVVPTKTGYGMGFSNKDNLDKSLWNEERYGSIYRLTTDEKNIVVTKAYEELKKYFK